MSTMMTFHSKKEACVWADRVITNISEKTHKTYPDGFIGQEDLAQAGWVGFCRCLENKSVDEADFRAYTYESIKRAIQEEQLKSVGILCFSLSVRRLCLIVYSRVSKGEQLPVVLKDLDISDSDWSNMKLLFDKYLSIDIRTTDGHWKNNRFNLRNKQDSNIQSDLLDLLDSKFLSEVDRDLVLSSAGQKSNLGNHCRTKMWKLRKKLQENLERGGYA